MDSRFFTTPPGMIQDAVIFGGNYVNQTHVHSEEIDVLELLLPHIVVTALHDSEARYDPPKCYPGTRRSVKTFFTKWVEKLERKYPISYLYGAAGAGKSAIAQWLAEYFSDKELLLASFFFSTTEEGRNTSTHFIPTLAYQIASNIPSTSIFIQRSIKKDPAIFRRSLMVQMRALILEPLQKAYDLAVQGETSTWPLLIVIDGVDECHGAEDQVRILDVFRELVQHTPFHLAISISCRPEVHIRTAFHSSALNGLSVKTGLENSHESTNDIRCYLEGKMKEIKEIHSVYVTFPPVWPPRKVIDTLVEKSSGQFIFPSLVVKFIGSPLDNPMERLEIVCGMATDTNDERPFAILDALYTHLISSVKPKYLNTVLRVMALKVAGADSWNTLLQLTNEGRKPFSQILSVREEEVQYSMKALDGILLDVVDNGNDIQFCHASVSDFLLDAARSRSYHQHVGQAHTHIAVWVFKQLQASAAKSWHPSSVLRVFATHTQKATPTSELHDLFTNFNPISFSTIFASYLRQDSRRWDEALSMPNILKDSSFHDKEELSSIFEKALRGYLSIILETYRRPPYNLLLQLLISEATVFIPCEHFGSYNACRHHREFWSILGFPQGASDPLCLQYLLNFGPIQGLKKIIEEMGYRVNENEYAHTCLTLMEYFFTCSRLTRAMSTGSVNSSIHSLQRIGERLSFSLEHGVLKEDKGIHAYLQPNQGKRYLNFLYGTCCPLLSRAGTSSQLEDYLQSPNVSKLVDKVSQYETTGRWLYTKLRNDQSLRVVVNEYLLRCKERRETTPCDKGMNGDILAQQEPKDNC